ncbi:MAG: hypothetical protein JW709_11205, partial [Sedimentisphaerales bacterium]|nr:hypothetical protein [Sedimentisphaerales bacterium]
MPAKRTAGVSPAWNSKPAGCRRYMVMFSSINILDRMERAVEKIKERLLRVTAALEAAGVRYAIIGGHAVAAWVATIDETAVRNTRDVDMLLDRGEFEAARTALESAGFIYRHVAGVDVFLDGKDARPREAVRVVFAGEQVQPDYELPAPDLSETKRLPGGLAVISLDALVRMKLTSFRIKDRVHLLDLINAGLLG